MKILLIDDEQSLLDVFSETLRTGTFDVVTALTGNDGFQKAKETRPDMILLDQVLPDINGNQVLQMLKGDPDTKNIPVAMLSNFNQDGMVQEAINLGALDYILKYQIEPKDLVAKVNSLFQEHASKPGFSMETPFVQPQPAQPAPQMPTAPVAEQPITPLPQQPVITEPEETTPTQ